MYISEVSNKTILAALIITLMGLGQTASAAVVLLSEFRSVSANVSVNTPGGSDSASTSRNTLGDFADFDESVEIDLSLEGASAADANGNTTPFDLSGTLFPNIYTLSANANIGANAFGQEAVGGAADFSLDFNVAPVPIPAAVWLFGSGLLGLVGIARRKKTA